MQEIKYLQEISNSLSKITKIKEGIIDNAFNLGYNSREVLEMLFEYYFSEQMVKRGAKKEKYNRPACLDWELGHIYMDDSELVFEYTNMDDIYYPQDSVGLPLYVFSVPYDKVVKFVESYRKEIESKEKSRAKRIADKEYREYLRLKKVFESD